MAYRFFAHPAHFLEKAPSAFPDGEWLQAPSSTHREVIELALTGAEYRNTPALKGLKALLSARADIPSIKPELGTSALFAQPPQDLPALLRLATSLEELSRTESGEKALVWRCECGTRYAVPMALVRTVAIVCERCQNPLQLKPSTSLGEEALHPPLQGAVNGCRKQLADFFREAMARGWPVLVGRLKAWG